MLPVGQRAQPNTVPLAPVMHSSQVYSQVLNYCRDELDWNSRAAVPVAGAAAGIALSFVLSPAELLKVGGLG